MSADTDILTDQITKLASTIDESVRQSRNSLDEVIRQVRNENDAWLRQVRNENEASFRQFRKEFQDANDPSSKPDPSQWAKSWVEIREDFRNLETTIRELGGEVASSKKEGDAKLDTAVIALKSGASALGVKIALLDGRVKETPKFSEVPGALLDYCTKHAKLIIFCLSFFGFLVWLICKQFATSQDQRLSALEKTIFINDQRLEKNIDAIVQDLKVAADQRTALELRINQELVSREARFYSKLDTNTERVAALEVLFRDLHPSSGGPTPANRSGVRMP